MLPSSPSTPRRGEKQHLWGALPNLVVKNEWEVHLKDLQRFVEELMRRVTRLEQGKQHTESQITQLSHTCKEVLCTKEALGKVEGRLDLALTELSRQQESNMLECRAVTRAEVDAARSDFGKEAGRIDDAIAVVNKSVSDLEHGLKSLRAHSETTYVPTASHLADCKQLRDEQQSAETEIRAQLQIFDELKASRAELGDSQAHLERDHVALRDGHEQTAQTLDKTCRALACLEKRSHDDLKSNMNDMANALAVVNQKLDLASEDRCALHSGLGCERGRLDALVQQQSEQSKELAQWMCNHHDLNAELSRIALELHGRCDELGKELKTLDRREKHSWEQFLNRRRNDQSQALPQ